MRRLPAIIHVGGGELQLLSIKWAREAGLYVVLTDINPDCPGRVLADRFEKISGIDVEALLQLAHKINQKFELVGAYCSNDFGLSGVAAISEAFSLPGPTVEAVQNALEKTRAREIWKREGLSIPKGWQVKTQEELTSLGSYISLPIIIKPPQSSGSQGVSSAWSEAEIKASFENARVYSDVVLVEEFIKGHHIDVNGLFLNDVFHPCGTLDRFFCDPPYHYPVWGCQPSSLRGREESQVYQLVERAARALGIDDGPVKGDVIFTKTGPVLLEVAPRFHGDVSTAFVTPHATGSSPTKAWFTYLAGKFEIGRPLVQNGSTSAGWMAVFPETRGIFGSIQGIDSALGVKGVREIVILKRKGTLLEYARDNTSVCGFIFASGDSVEKVGNILKEARGCLTVETE
jgi:biotin carboxylase